MDIDKFIKVIKLIELSSTDNDHECLASIRKAHEIVKSTNVDWKTFVIKGVYSFNKRMNALQDYLNPNQRRNSAIEIWFDKLDEYGYDNDFVHSLKHYYFDNKKLSEKQFLALRKIARECWRLFDLGEWEPEWDEL